MMNLQRALFLSFIILFSGFYASNAQTRKIEANTLFTAGHAGAFVAGLYDAFYPYDQLMKHGNFGLGAPDKLDGELMILDGKIYQTQSSGKTFEIQPKGILPFAMINFFKTDKVLTINTPTSKAALFEFLDKALPEKNAIFAIRIKGKFQNVKTRAFPMVTEKPYLPLAKMLDRQHFFDFSNNEGDFVGYRIPAHMDGPNITGYHFHYISSDKKSGGHVVDFNLSNVTIEVDYLSGFTVEIPQTKDFFNFNFTKAQSEDVKRAESGKKN